MAGELPWTRSKHAKGIRVIPPTYVKMPTPLDESDERLFNMDHVFGLDDDPDRANSNIRSRDEEQMKPQMAGDMIDRTTPDNSLDKSKSKENIKIPCSNSQQK